MDFILKPRQIGGGVKKASAGDTNGIHFPHEPGHKGQVELL